MSVRSGRGRRLERGADDGGGSGGRGRADHARDPGTEGLQPATLACAIVFSGFAVYHALTVAPGPRGLAVGCDLAVFVLCSAVYLICRRSRLTPGAFHLITSALSVAIASDSLLCGVLGVNPLFSHFDSLIVIGTVVVIPSPRWASAAIAIQLAGWAVVACLVLPHDEIIPDVFVMASSVAVGFIIHAGRLRARRRILELRAGDARREQALQRAL